MASRRRELTCAALLLALAGGAAPARADEYLENPNGREGFMFGVAAGGALYAGVGDYDRSPNLGASPSVRFGTSAGPRLLWMFQADNLTYLLKDPDPASDVVFNQTMLVFTVAGQYYVSSALWIKGGVGTASISRVNIEGGGRERQLDNGIGGMGSIGLDLKRWGSWVFGLEGVGATGMFGEGMISYGGVRGSISRY